MKRFLTVLAVVLMVASCSRSSNDPGVTPTTGTTPSTVELSAEPLVGAKPEREWVDSDAILAASGFQRCPDGAWLVDQPVPVADDVFAELTEAGVASWLSQADPDAGLGARIGLRVLDAESLTAVGDRLSPDDVCVEGQDPNDYVPVGAQPTEGPGWVWVGAGAGWADRGPDPLMIELITNQTDYDALWDTTIGDHTEPNPVSGRPAIDFGRQTIMTISHNYGTTFGECGLRIDAVWADDGKVVIDLFSPGGELVCPAIAVPAVYAIAVDHELSGPPPFTVLTRSGPRAEPTPQRIEGPAPADPADTD